jgi:hypothetical protein
MPFTKEQFALWLMPTEQLRKRAEQVRYLKENSRYHDMSDDELRERVRLIKLLKAGGTNPSKAGEA